MPSTRDQAVCIRHWDWSETSQTVSLLTRSLGVVRGIAKGAKRERSPFSGGIELLTRGEVVAIVKTTSELATITAWDLQETFPAIRRSLSAFHSAMYMADVAQASIHDRDPHPVIFDVLLASLRILGQGEDRRIVLGFIWATLGETGWQPELGRDVISGRALEDAAVYGFVPSLGGFTSDGSVLPESASPGPIWRARAETLRFLRGLPESDRSGPAGAVERAARLLNAYLGFVLGRELATAAALFQDAGEEPRG